MLAPRTKDRDLGTGLGLADRPLGAAARFDGVPLVVVYSAERDREEQGMSFRESAAKLHRIVIPLLEVGSDALMTAMLWTVVATLLADAVVLAWLLFRLLLNPATTVRLADIAPFFVLAGVITALVAFLTNLRRARSEDVLVAAGDLLEKGHGALLTRDGVLTNGRHAWLSAARLIATAETLSKRITESSHKTIYEQRREYWRGRVYDLIFPSAPEGLPSTFYAEMPEHMIAHLGDVRAPLAEKSLAFLYRFINWPKERQDPIGEEQSFSDVEIERMKTFGPRGLGNLIGDARAFAKNPRRNA